MHISLFSAMHYLPYLSILFRLNKILGQSVATASHGQARHSSWTGLTWTVRDRPWTICRQTIENSSTGNGEVMDSILPGLGKSMSSLWTGHAWTVHGEALDRSWAGLGQAVDRQYKICGQVKDNFLPSHGQAMDNSWAGSGQVIRSWSDCGDSMKGRDKLHAYMMLL